MGAVVPNPIKLILDQWNLNYKLFTAQGRLFTRCWPWAYKLESFHLSLNYDCEGDLDGEN